ncbi:MAG: PAS domain S-box protein [Alphaproteobacteria bacterium]|nr:PAS domain S-box protein [Alphaproteobacteria bacterium]
MRDTRLKRKKIIPAAKVFHANEVLRLGEEPLRLLVDGVKDYAIILLDPHGRIATWNEGARRLKGYTQAEIIGRSMKLFYPPEAVAAGLPDRLLAQAAAEGRVEDEGWRVRKDGSRFFADVILTPVHSAAGELLGFAKITRNISQRKQAEDALRLSEERFRLLVSGVKDYAIIMLDPAGLIVTWNEGARRLKGYTQAEIIGHSMKKFYPPEAIAAGLPDRLLAQAAAEGRVEDEGWRVRKDGSRFFANVVLTAMRDAGGALTGFAKITRDITERKENEEKLRASEARYRLLADNATDVIMLVGPDGRRLYVSPASRAVLGYEPEELVDLPVGGLVHPEDRAAWSGSRRQALNAPEGEITEAIYRCIRKDGSLVWVEADRQRCPGDLGYVVSIRDITERKQMQDQLANANRRLEELVTRDGLTGIANRRFFDEALQIEIRRAAREQTTLAVIMMDIDYFKEFNDRYGHLAGDDCLRAVAVAIKNMMRRPADLAARYGGEEFVVLLPNTSEDGAVIVAEQILEGVRQLNITHQGSPQKLVTISAGLMTTVPKPGSEQPDALIEGADQKLYRAKHKGKNQLCV